MKLLLVLCALFVAVSCDVVTWSNEVDNRGCHKLLRLVKSNPGVNPPYADMGTTETCCKQKFAAGTKFPGVNVKDTDAKNMKAAGDPKNYNQLIKGKTNCKKLGYAIGK